MKSEVKVYPRTGGEIQRVQVVRWDDWAALDFLQTKPGERALDCFEEIYRNYLVPACPWIFGQMILFSLPDDLDVEVPQETERYGAVGDNLTAAAVCLQNGVKIRSGAPVFRDVQSEMLWQTLEARGCIRLVRGKLPFTKVIPVGKHSGYLSKSEPNAALRVNASFFIMDPIDCATIYDQVGTSFGLCVKEGEILNPPLYFREALLVYRDGRVRVSQMDVRMLDVEINGTRFEFGKNANLFTRPMRAKTPLHEEGKKIAIVGNRVVAVKESGRMDIPASGFVLCPVETCAVAPGDRVTYHGLEDVMFGIQVGNSILRDGVKTEAFYSDFYNIRRLERVSYPPSLYPMDFVKARAARIALGADAEGKPMLLWAEGAGKLCYKPGEDSTGASLAEMVEIAADLGMHTGVHLDGGGSAQILLHGQRALHISDRNPSDHSDAERMVPLGLVIRE